MPVDVKGFVTPEQNFEGMYRPTDTMRENKLLEERKAEKDYDRQREEKAKTASSMRYFANYLDPKDRYTGTYYDPKMNELLGDALSQANELAGKGAGEAEILTAISPLVNKANTYQQKAKMYSEGKKQFLDALKSQKGYNASALGKYMDEMAFEGKNIDDVDPTDILGFANKAFQKYGSQVTTDDAINEYVKKLPTSQMTSDIISYNSKGGRQRNKAMIDMPNIFRQEEENGVTTFVPKYDKATDFGEDIVGNFTDDKGKEVEAPVRLLDEKIFDGIINENPAIKHRVESMVQDAINSGEYKDSKGNQISLTSPQAKNLGRALLYDELKNKAEIKRNILQETKPAVIHVSTGGSGGGTKNAGGDWVNRATAALHSGDNQKIQDAFAQLFQGDKNNFVSAEVSNGKLNVTIKPAPKYDIMGKAIEEANKPTVFEGGLDLNDRYLPQKLAKLYQTVMGGDVKVERSQYNPQQPSPAPKPAGGKTRPPLSSFIKTN